MRGEEDHECSHTAKVGVSLECAPDTGPGPTLEIGLGPTPGANLGVLLGPTIKATFIMIHVACVPSPQTNLHPEEE